MGKGEEVEQARKSIKNGVETKKRKSVVWLRDRHWLVCLCPSSPTVPENNGEGESNCFLGFCLRSHGAGVLVRQECVCVCVCVCKVRREGERGM